MTWSHLDQYHNVVFVVYLSSTISTDAITIWLDQLQQSRYMNPTALNDKGFPRHSAIMVGNNKIDQIPVVDRATMIELSDKYGIPYYDVVTTTGEGVHDVIKALIAKATGISDDNEPNNHQHVDVDHEEKVAAHQEKPSSSCQIM